MHNTGNPLGSKDILDLYDNSETIDNFVNSQQDEVPDRFGTKRLTLAGLIKRSMALRNEINDFSGALTFKPEWSDVPMNVSEGVGGEGGALNLQAEALGNRVSILSSIISFNTISDLKNRVNNLGITIDFEKLPEGTKIGWLGYYNVSDGGGNWGTLKKGPPPYADDGGSIFVIDTNNYVQANLKGGAVSVLKFGAIGDGVIDDSTRIIKTIAAAADIRIPNKYNFKISKLLELTSGQSLTGRGTITSVDTANNVISINNATDVVIEKVKVIRHLAAAASGYLSCNIFVKNSSKVKIKSTTMEVGQIGAGIKFANCTDCSARKNTVYAYDIYDPSVLDSTIPDGIAVIDASTDIDVSNNTIYNIGTAVSIQNVAGPTDIFRVTVMNNKIRRCGGYGIMSYKLGANIQDVIITGNIIKDVYGCFFNPAANNHSHGAGIYLQGSILHTVNNNTIRNCCLLTDSETLSPAGISVAGGFDCDISHNTIIGSKRYGILLDGTGHIAAFNTIKGCDKSGLYSRNSIDSTFSGNKVSEPTTSTSGLLLASISGSEHRRMTVSHNNIKGYSTSISIYNVYDSDIVDNICNQEGVASNIGIGSTVNGDNVRIRGNDVTVQGGFGIRCQIPKSVITGNEIKGAVSGQQINIYSGTGTYVSDNRMEGIGTNDAAGLKIIALTAELQIPFTSRESRFQVTGTGTIQGVSHMDPDSTLSIMLVSGVTLVHQGTGAIKFKLPGGVNYVTSGSVILTFRMHVFGYIQLVGIQAY